MTASEVIKALIKLDNQTRPEVFYLNTEAWEALAINADKNKKKQFKLDQFKAAVNPDTGNIEDCLSFRGKPVFKDKL